MRASAVFPLLLCCAVAFAAEKTEYFRIMKDAFKSSDYEQGIVALEKAVKEYPDEAEFHAGLVYLMVNAGQYDRALAAGRASIKRFPLHARVADSYRVALVGAGWDSLNGEDVRKAYGLFRTAYDRYPDDPEAINGYGHVLMVMKRSRAAVEVLERGYAMHPEFSHIRINLSWACFAVGDELFDAGKVSEAGKIFRRGYELGDKNDVDLYVAYLYRLPRFGGFREGSEILTGAMKRFGNNDELYWTGFWLLHSLADWHRDRKEYDGMIQALKGLYTFSAGRELIYKDDMTFSHLALSKASIEVFAMIEAICPYWRAFTGSERETARPLLAEMRKDLPKEFQFIYFNLLGHILYREGRVPDAHVEFLRAYNLLMRLPLAKRFRYGEEVAMPFPLRGIFMAANCDSAHYVTHMGLNRWCYDIYGSDEKGALIRPGVEEQRSRLSDWYGYGAVIYSPLGGKVIAAEDDNPDDIPYPATPGKGNYIDIMTDDGKILHFYHIQRGSLMVRKGDRVEAGGRIARLGNSSSFTPHIHFGVYSKDWLVSHPVFFTDYSLIENESRRHVPRGQPSINRENQEIIEVK
ncbi:MAG: tetratricopeptide repeat protein [Chrysiogenales bacterium]|nr:MAG: tetratricopeptide repeat protein [Chrysiogenales bacterium]